MVAIETAWQGRPIVATRVGGLPEPVADGETGFVVEPEDSAALAYALARLLEDPQLAARMGDAARSRAVNQYAVDRYADDYERLYEQLTRTRMHAGTR
jgi:glycosyltransferase involved in cell wall biosynthesis